MRFHIFSSKPPHHTVFETAPDTMLVLELTDNDMEDIRNNKKERIFTSWYCGEGMQISRLAMELNRGSIKPKD